MSSKDSTPATSSDHYTMICMDIFAYPKRRQPEHPPSNSESTCAFVKANYEGDKIVGAKIAVVQFKDPGNFRDGNYVDGLYSSDREYHYMSDTNYQVKLNNNEIVSICSSCMQFRGAQVLN